MNEKNDEMNSFSFLPSKFICCVRLRLEFIRFENAFNLENKNDCVLCMVGLECRHQFLIHKALSLIDSVDIPSLRFQLIQNRF